MKRFLADAFRFQSLLSGRRYFAIGSSLMLVKYLGDMLINYFFQSVWLTPLEFLNPFLSQRWSGHPSEMNWFLWSLIIWSLPFTWVGFSCTVRRLIDAGRGPLWAFLFFVPGLNLALMIGLCFLPTSKSRRWAEDIRQKQSVDLKESVVAMVVSSLLCTLTISVLVYVFASYGSALFLGVPVAYGFFLSGWLNLRRRRPFWQVSSILLLSISLAGGLLLLFAMEGAICIAMAAPIFLAMSFIGAGLAECLFGRWRPKDRTGSLQVFAVFVLPVLFQPLLNKMDMASSESLHEVLSSVEISAPPSVVWPKVVAFSEIPRPEEWIFRMGVSYPIRAVIEGRGVGAVRRCQFSTGDFVEPITVWDEPHVLGFSVRYQPRPMFELSPYEQVHAPHLDGFITSERGQFNLVALANGHTRLEGRTWYKIKIFPIPYWVAFADVFIHKIHMRVLDHIRADVEL